MKPSVGRLRKGAPFFVVDTGPGWGHTDAAMKNETLPAAGFVRIDTATNRYARTRNGAWVGAGAENSTREFAWAPGDDFVDWRPSGYSSYTLLYPDGRVENLDCANTPCRFSDYGPEAGNKPVDYNSSKWSRCLGAIGYNAWTPHETVLAERRAAHAS